MSGERTFTIVEEDLVAGNRLHARQQWNRRAVVKAWLAFAAILAALAYLWCPRSILLLVAIPLAATVWMAFGWLAAQVTFARAARRSFGEIKPFLRHTTITWDNDSIRLASERGEVSDRWTSYYAWAADDRTVSLYQSAHMFITVPVRDIGLDAKDEIVGLLKAAGVKERSAR